MNDRVVTLDVRTDLEQRRDPFSRIMKAAASLRPDQTLLIIAPFEPVPLYRMLAQQGFSYVTRATGNGDWEVLFSRTDAEATAATELPVTPPADCCCSKAVSTVEVDARGLEPPQPLVAILEALASLPPGTELRARTDRRPMHLYAQLEQRGFFGETTAEEDGSFVTRIRRK